MMSKQKILGFHGSSAFMSNFVPVQVILDGIIFSSVEHAFVAAKTLDLEMREAIANIVSPGKAKRFGRKISLRQGWEQIKIDVMKDLLIQKFSQAHFTSQLLKTGDAYLEETNTWHDTFWGVHNGIGENNLGKLLMQIREDLKELERGQAGNAAPC